MKKALKFGLILFIVLIIGGVAALWTPDTNRAEMIAKYGGSNPMFIEDGNGFKIHVRDQGLRRGEALILIHGGNSSLHVWEKMVEDLSDDFRVISLDLPGHGLTGVNQTGDYSPDAMVDAIETVMDRLAVEKAIWVGNSFGGWIAWRGALSRSDRVSGLVLVDASGAITDDPIKPYLAARIARSPLGKLLVPNFTPKSIVRASLKQVMSDDGNVTEALVERNWELARFPGNRDAILDIQKLDRESDEWNKIQNINVPTLILWGEDDVTMPLSFAKAFNNKIENSVLIMHPNAAHVPMEEIPIALSRDIKNWYKVAYNKTSSSDE